MGSVLARMVGIAAVATAAAGCVVDPYYDHRHGRYDRPYDNRPYDDRPAPRQDYERDDRHELPTILCGSKEGRPKRCHTDFPIKRAELDKKYSGSPCEYGRSWGFDSNEVWVDRGCRARFRLYPAGRWR